MTPRLCRGPRDLLQLPAASKAAAAMPSLRRRKGFDGDSQYTVLGSSTTDAASVAAVAVASGGHSTGSRRGPAASGSGTALLTPSRPSNVPSSVRGGTASAATPPVRRVCLFADCRRLLEQPAAGTAAQGCAQLAARAPWRAAPVPAGRRPTGGSPQAEPRPGAGAGQWGVAPPDGGAACCLHPAALRRRQQRRQRSTIRLQPAGAGAAAAAVWEGSGMDSFWLCLSQLPAPCGHQPICVQ